ncbi:MAG: molybdopterin-synthase adenylyltransferase MoeB [Candidatus Eremiobacteraeota bacterium]|nr:molybdopterin-synthase adenylyltransferase MoeB [Candidatus Eremiobacteraeota bacterium]
MDVIKSADLSRAELARYSRHLVLPEVGMAGQRKLKAASVLLVGAGGLGSPLGLYLAAAGVGRLGIVDDDHVDETNLQRQVIHSSASVGESKVQSAAQRINDLNPNVEVSTYPFRLDASRALGMVTEYDVTVDGSDNFPTRFLVNDACVLAGKPNVYGSVYRFEGQASVFDARRGPCYRCLFPQPPPAGSVPSCAEGGVLGVLPGIIGLIQATETIKLIIGAGNPLIGRLLIFDALDMRFASLSISKDDACPICSATPSITRLRDEDVACDPLPADARRFADSDADITPRTLRAKLDRGESLELLDVREPVERDIAKLPNTREIPLGDLARHLDELPKDKEIVVYCRVGGRSAQAAQLLRAAGFSRVRNLLGGLHAWIDDVDPTLTRY